MFRLITLTIVFASLLMNSAAQNAPATPAATKLPDGPGEKLVEKTCQSCHTVSTFTSKRHSADDWADEVEKMVSRGAVLTDAETDQVVQYLATHYGPEDAKGGQGIAPEANAQPSSDKSTAPAASGAPSAVNVNKASVQELENSLGLSEAEAGAIVHYRAENGSFKDWHEVSTVPGVPAEKIRDNQARLVF
jgi:competence protein ComEA